MDSSTPMLLLAGVLFLVVGADMLVRGASRLAVSAGISPLVVGLTVVALGTSAPELAVTIQSALAGETTMALGNVVGSNISNVLFVLGIGAVIAPLTVAQKMVRLEVPLILLISLVVFALSLDGKISRFEGLALFCASVFYTVFAIRRSRMESRAVAEKYADEMPLPVADKSTQTKEALKNTGWMVLGLVSLVLGARSIVAGALDIGQMFGLSELVCGLTIVALGTSLPEVATVVVASLRGERAIAVGNVVGSNLYNLLVVLGVGAVASEDGLVVPNAALHFDLPVMCAVAAACLPIFFTGLRINRWEGLLFLAYYLAYISYMVMMSKDHELLPRFSMTMGVFVIPLTVLAIGVTSAQSLRARADRKAGSGLAPKP